nr:uncharacterized protein LOC123283560 [Equus asinus]
MRRSPTPQVANRKPGRPHTALASSTLNNGPTVLSMRTSACPEPLALRRLQSGGAHCAGALQDAPPLAGVHPIPAEAPNQRGDGRAARALRREPRCGLRRPKAVIATLAC